MKKVFFILISIFLACDIFEPNAQLDITNSDHEDVVVIDRGRETIISPGETRSWYENVPTRRTSYYQTQKRIAFTITSFLEGIEGTKRYWHPQDKHYESWLVVRRGGFLYIKSHKEEKEEIEIEKEELR